MGTERENGERSGRGEKEGGEEEGKGWPKRAGEEREKKGWPQRADGSWGVEEKKKIIKIIWGNGMAKKRRGERGSLCVGRSRTGNVAHANFGTGSLCGVTARADL